MRTTFFQEVPQVRSITPLPKIWCKKTLKLLFFTAVKKIYHGLDTQRESRQKKDDVACSYKNHFWLTSPTISKPPLKEGLPLPLSQRVL